MTGTATASDPAILTVQGLSKRFGGLQAVDSVDFEVARGQVTALIGPNGAGKSTTFNLITGHARPDRGRVCFDGQEVTHQAPHRRAAKGIARSFQSAKLFPSMTVREILTTAALLRDDLRKARDRADSVMEEVGLGSKADCYPDELSLPDRQMVELGKCVATQPTLILLDEIMGGLNRVESAVPVAAIARLRDRGISFLMVEHVMPVVMSLADHIVVLDFGKRIAAGTPEEIARDEAVQRSYLGEPDAGTES